LPDSDCSSAVAGLEAPLQPAVIGPIQSCGSLILDLQGHSAPGARDGFLFPLKLSLAGKAAFTLSCAKSTRSGTN
jgi:hypothetical protein